MRERIRTSSWSVVGVCVAMAACLPGGCSSDPARVTPVAVEPAPIFNGKDLSGWEGDPSLWRVQNGVLIGETTAERPIAHNSFLIYRGREVTDFVFECEYSVRSDWANSGIQYRSVELPSDGNDAGRWIVSGYQADIDEPVQYTGILYGERDRGILALRGQRVEIQPGGAPKVMETFADGGELAARIGGKDRWNHYTIEVRGNHATHWINGVKVAEITDNDGVVEEPGAKGARRQGILALQLHTGAPMKIQFRNLTLQP